MAISQSETDPHVESQTGSEINEDIESEPEPKANEIAEAETGGQEQETCVKHSKAAEVYTHSGRQVKRPEYLQDYVCQSCCK